MCSPVSISLFTVCPSITLVTLSNRIAAPYVPLKLREISSDSDARGQLHFGSRQM